MTSLATQRSNMNTDRFSARGVFGAKTYQPENYNEYLYSVLVPTTAAMIPDLNMTPCNSKTVAITKTMEWKGTGSAELFGLYTPENRDYPLRLYVRNPGEQMHFLMNVQSDEPLADSFIKARLVSAGVTVKSNTVSSGNFNVAGNINAVRVAAIPRFSELTYNSLISNKQGPGTFVQAIGVESGVVMLHQPNGPHLFWTPHTPNVMNIDETTVGFSKSPNPGWELTDPMIFDSQRVGAIPLFPDPGFGWYEICADLQIGAPVGHDFRAGSSWGDANVLAVGNNALTGFRTDNLGTLFTAAPTGWVCVVPGLYTFNFRVSGGVGVTPAGLVVVRGADNIFIDTMTGLPDTTYQRAFQVELAAGDLLEFSCPASATGLQGPFSVSAYLDSEAPDPGNFELQVVQAQTDPVTWAETIVTTTLSAVLVPSSPGFYCVKTCPMYFDGLIKGFQIRNVGSVQNVLGGSICVKGFTFYSSNATQPSEIFCMSSVNAGQSVAITGVLNYEVVPNADLQKNFPTRNSVEDPIDMELAEALLATVGHKKLKVIYPLPMYSQLIASGYFEELCSYQSIYNASPPSIRSKLREIWREVRDAGQSFGRQHGGEFVTLMADPIVGPVGAAALGGLTHQLFNSSSGSGDYHALGGHGSNHYQASSSDAPMKVEHGQKSHLQDWITGNKKVITMGTITNRFPVVAPTNDPNDATLGVFQLTNALPADRQQHEYVEVARGKNMILKVPMNFKDSLNQSVEFWGGVQQFVNTTSAFSGTFYIVMRTPGQIDGESWQAAFTMCLMGISVKGAITGTITWAQGSAMIGPIGDIGQKLFAANREGFPLIFPLSPREEILQGLNWIHQATGTKMSVGTMQQLFTGLKPPLPMAGHMVMTAIEAGIAANHLALDRKKTRAGLAPLQEKAPPVDLDALSAMLAIARAKLNKSQNWSQGNENLKPWKAIETKLKQYEQMMTHKDFGKNPAGARDMANKLTAWTDGILTQWEVAATSPPKAKKKKVKSRANAIPSGKQEEEAELDFGF